eukprot:gene23091-biopygen20799
MMENTETDAGRRRTAPLVPGPVYRWFLFQNHFAFCYVCRHLAQFTVASLHVTVSLIRRTVVGVMVRHRSQTFCTLTAPPNGGPNAGRRYRRQGGTAIPFQSGGSAPAG